MASTKMSMTTMPMNIFDAAEGLRASALMTARPKTAITTDGPMTATNIIPTIIKVSANMFIPLIGTEITPETTIGIVSNIQVLIAENQVVLGISGLILIIGLTVSKLFSIAMKTDVYNQLKKRRSIL